MKSNLKKTIISSVPYVFIALFATKLGQHGDLLTESQLVKNSFILPTDLVKPCSHRCRVFIRLICLSELW